jgi:Ni,Fe-hydrogenase III large subunit/Ni,Fe-hydrogenase III component G
MTDTRGTTGHGSKPLTGNRTVVEVPRPGGVGAFVGSLLDDGYRLALVAAHDEAPTAPAGAAGAALRVVYLLVRGSPDSRIEVQVRLDPDVPAIPTLAHLSFPASRFEREMRDLYGIVPLNHPLPRRLIRHPHWPRGWYPMRRDAGPAPSFEASGEPFPLLAVEGRGVDEIPVGPVHAGLSEPGHFRFSVVGETILKLKARLWYKHKGVEGLFSGRRPETQVALAERISGDTAVGHALAFCLAVEEALGICVGDDAQRMRALLLEMERLHNHVADVGALCNYVGFGIAHARAQGIRETLLCLNARTTGHRLLRGGVHVGGARLDYVPTSNDLDPIADAIRGVVALALRHSVVRDRFTGTAVLPERHARALGTLGYVARASGLDYDARRAHPFTDLGDALTVPTRSSGDVMARFLVRADEIDTSLKLITRLGHDLTAGRIDATPPADGCIPRSGVGIVEGWRGAITHRVELTDDYTLARVKVVDPSFFNWPALPVALTNTIVPDFPLANKSFNLSYAGNDL